jgi:hypothetical protein
VCSHPDLKEIDRGLVSRQSYRVIARQFSIGKDSLRRHAQQHLPATLAKGHEASEVARADDLIEKIKGLQERTTRLLDKAERSGKWHSAFVGVGQYRQNLELLARLLGELKEAAAVQVNLHETPEWIQLRTLLLLALDRFPEAKAAVIEAMAQGPETAG